MTVESPVTGERGLIDELHVLDQLGFVEERREVVAALIELERCGLNHNSSGNVSRRLPDGQVLVSPSGMAPKDVTVADVVLLNSDGSSAVPGQRVPTSEWQLHVAIYADRERANAIVHTHSPEATAASALRRALPAIHYVLARCATGDSLRCAPYHTYGTAELAEAVVATLAGQGLGCLMANHGAIALGATMPAAIALALDIEWFCRVHRLAVAAGEPTPLSADEIADVAERMRSYGQSAS